MANRILMGTSISPYGDLQHQYKCIQSWILAGFAVVSFNVPTERELIEDFFSDIPIEFVSPKRTALDVCGKPLPYLQSIFEDLKQINKEGVLGFFNSDIYFNALSENYVDFLACEAEDSLLIVHRYEIDSLNERSVTKLETNFDGIDVVLFDANISDKIFGDWAYVQGAWDSSILIKCEREGVKTKTVIDPICLHVRHKVRWDWKRVSEALKIVSDQLYDSEKEAFLKRYFDKYRCLLQCTEYISKGDNKRRRFLFVVDDWADEEQIAGIKNQIGHDVFIKDKYKESEEKYDYIVYVPHGIEIIKNFCNYIVAIDDYSKFGELNIYAFCISKTYNFACFSQVNKNLELLHDINKEYKLVTRVLKEKTSIPYIEVYYPVTNHIIDFRDNNVVHEKLTGFTYIMPSGYRAYEWYATYSKRLEKIQGFIDNDKSKQGEFILNIPIISLENVINKCGAENSRANIIVTSKYYHNEIVAQLNQYPEYINIIDGDRVLWIDEDGYAFIYH